MTQPEPTAPAVTGPLRTCIATGEEGTPERMIRFVVGPQGDIVPDLARRLPGRGMWVRAERRAIEHAVAKNLFAKSAKAAVRPAADLPERVERLLLERALADLGRARRAGRAVAGFVKVEQMIGRRQAGLLVIADEAADNKRYDGTKRRDQADQAAHPLDHGPRGRGQEQ
jgi:predicted RNA-binding protein YlxR (DUF448 family)